MKLPGIPKGHRSTDPLGDPLQGLDLDADGVDDVDPLVTSVTSGRGGNVAEGAGLGDMDLDAYAEPLDPPKGIVARLFGAEDGLDPRRDDDDIGGGRSGLRTLVMAGVGVLLLGGGAAAGWWLWQGEEDPSADPTTVVEDGAGAVAPLEEMGGAVPVLLAPDHIVMTMPPLRIPDDARDVDLNNPQVVSDATAATDRSAQRRPWLAGAEGGAAGAGHGDGDQGVDDHGVPHMVLADKAHHAEETSAEDGHDGGAHGAGDMASATPPTHGEGHGDGHGGDDHGVMADAGADAGADTGVRHRVDMAAPDLDLPDVPGLLPVPAGIGPLTEPPLPNRMDGDELRIPTYKALETTAGDRPLPLPAAPFSALQEVSSHGAVPAIGPDGTAPWRAYAARDDAPPEQPRVAIVVYGLGMMADPLEAAVSKLPPQVTLSFSPYASDLRSKLAMAREAGHEVLLDLPMEPDNFPARDPGPMGLLTLLPKSDNVDHLERIMASGTGYVGVMAGNDGRFSESPEHMEPVLKRLRQAGLLYLHRGSPQSLVANLRYLPPVTKVDVDVDSVGYAESLRARLDYLRRLALARGTAVGAMQATPLNFTVLRDWAAGLPASGIALAPVSSVVARSGGDSASSAAATVSGAAVAPQDDAGHGDDASGGHSDPHQAGEGHG